jgi:anti-sigma factor RsiW
MSAIDSLSCKELVELVTAYLEDSLPPDERARFEAHLTGCRGCRNYLDQARKTLFIVNHLEEEHLTQQAQTRLLAAFRDWKKS